MTFLRTDPDRPAVVYVPTWQTSGADPAIGDGTLAGRYIKNGKIVHARVRIDMGAATTFGGAGLAWEVGLPAAEPALNTAVGTGLAFDSSAGLAYLVSWRSDLFLRTYASPVGFVASNVPFAWAAGDFLELMLAYEVA